MKGRGKPWSEADHQVLRDHYGKASYARIAEMLGRSPESVKSRAGMIGLQRSRRLTDQDRAFIQAHYRRMPTREIAQRLGRTPASVHQVAIKLGVAGQHRPPIDAAEQATIRQFVALGWCNPCIARRLGPGRDRHTIGEWRKKLGLPASTGQQTCPRCKERTRQTTLRQCAAAGVDNLGELRGVVLAEKARKHGWPDGVLAREVDILNALETHGPMTRRHIMEACGFRIPASVHNGMGGNGPARSTSYLGHLIQLGLVVSLGRVVRTGRKGGNLHLYSLALDAQRSFSPEVPHEPAQPAPQQRRSGRLDAEAQASAV